ncbi:GNAT family N-acetyltransferase [archaeon]|jgi:ribosomal protein S18 acetylase RimI-like enzyme|nr:GNAT family N-acetyltransferase [archaeon]MBT6820023.1 GNAT family N-acetyltransferase [archaeon]MBT6956542.1 GNAT family N-acetyltransferase [archaeon]MBT7238679.1 GNAT family N-acetyltransferase [archaeon]MBT7567806.1 GNAT family N-acetyltransferase [archaeon]
MKMRKCKKGDVESVKEIALMAFGENKKVQKKILGNVLFKAFYSDWQKKKNQTIEYLYKSRDCKIYVAEKDNKILGFASFRLNKNKPLTAEILTNAVSPKYQQQGIGSALYKKLISEVKRLGIKYLHVNTDNENAKKAYEKVGFVKNIQATNYFMRL